jgi:hypothetical protein
VLVVAIAAEAVPAAQAYIAEQALRSEVLGYVA